MLLDDDDLIAVEEQCTEYIESPWVDRLVHAMVGGYRPDLEDLAQEARLAMWQAAPRWDKRGDLEGYLHQKARWRVLSLLRGDHLFTGQEQVRAISQQRGDESRQRVRDTVAALRATHHREPTATEVATELGIHPATARKQLRQMTLTKLEVSAQVRSLDALIEAYGVQAILGVSAQFDSVLLAYHYGEIHRAVAELEPLWREYVYLRFWGGYGDSEIARTLGCRVHWHNRVRPRLAEQLSHLVDAV